LLKYARLAGPELVIRDAQFEIPLAFDDVLETGAVDVGQREGHVAQIAPDINRAGPPLPEGSGEADVSFMGLQTGPGVHVLFELGELLAGDEP